VGDRRARPDSSERAGTLFSARITRVPASACRSLRVQYRLASFEHGVGTFYSDYIADGKPMRVRFIWSHISANSARWEQANSSDEGKTWDTNWTMEFERTAP
jgi:hypothetical protein